MKFMYIMWLLPVFAVLFYEMDALAVVTKVRTPVTKIPKSWTRYKIFYDGNDEYTLDCFGSSSGSLAIIYFDSKMIVQFNLNVCTLQDLNGALGIKKSDTKEYHEMTVHKGNDRYKMYFIAVEDSTKNKKAKDVDLVPEAQWKQVVSLQQKILLKDMDVEDSMDLNKILV